MKACDARITVLKGLVVCVALVMMPGCKSSDDANKSGEESAQNFQTSAKEGGSSVTIGSGKNAGENRTSWSSGSVPQAGVAGVPFSGSPWALFVVASYARQSMGGGRVWGARWGREATSTPRDGPSS